MVRRVRTLFITHDPREDAQFRAAGALVVATGSTSVLVGRHPQWLVRKATSRRTRPSGGRTPASCG
ncbi:hypothetical protein DMH01_21740 [Amycolatopsis sp. WAC 04182]|nr:hypothetical protein DMH01_21740 [Amycolatopsis sp. WAC 04182]